ncbi:hypothetical protein CU098_014007, partial [Rhizopus stolonifer]
MNAAQKKALQFQFDNSRYAKNPPKIPPKKIAVFTFDNVLFLSPQLSPNLWLDRTIPHIKADNKIGPGWLNDIRSLRVGPLEEMKKTAWEGFWNEDVVQLVRESIKDPNTLTALCAFRPHYPFHDLINTMLESKGLHFDVVGLIPDPVERPNRRWSVQSRAKLKVTYKNEPDIFPTMGEFNNMFLMNLLSNLKNIDSIEMILRKKNTNKKTVNLIKKLTMMTELKFDIKHINKICPKYNPSWELNTVKDIVESHNAVLDAMYHGSDSQGWDTVPNNNLRRADEKFVDIAMHDICTSIKILPEFVQKLKLRFEPIFQQMMKANEEKMVKGSDEKKLHKNFGEQPVFFGDMARLSKKLLMRPCCGVLGNESTMYVDAVSTDSSYPSLVVRLHGEQKEHYHILPLWFRPSQEETALRKNRTWLHLTEEPKLELKGLIVYEKRIKLTDVAVPSAYLPKVRKKVKLQPKNIKLPMDKEIEHLMHKEDNAKNNTENKEKPSTNKPCSQNERGSQKRFRLKSKD